MKLRVSWKSKFKHYEVGRDFFYQTVCFWIKKAKQFQIYSNMYRMTHYLIWII